jgi:hypothetical protein
MSLRRRRYRRCIRLQGGVFRRTGKAAYSLSSYSVVLGGRQWGWGSVAGRVEPLGCGFLLLASHLVVG